MRLYISILFLLFCGIVGLTFAEITGETGSDLNQTIIPNNTPVATPTPGSTASATPTSIITTEVTKTPTIVPVITQVITEVTITPNSTPVVTPTPGSTASATPTIVPVIIPVITTETTIPTETNTPVPSPTILQPATAEPTIQPTSVVTGTPTVIPTVINNQTGKQTLVNQVASPISASSLSGNFSFISSPSGATVTFDGSSAGTTPFTVAVDETSSLPHTVIMEKSGYQTWNSSIDHNPASGTTETISATLQALPQNGSLSVSSTPSGATVAIDGANIQTTPYTYPEVTPGSHAVSVSKDGYSPYSTTVTVASGAESVVSAVLNPVTTTGSLTVETYPPGAVILLNGVVYGTTPAHYDAVPTGTYTMQLVKAGFQTVTKTIEISSGQENKVQVVMPRWFPPTGTLSIRSFPEGGVVTLDGNTRGITPVRIFGLHPDSYNVRVSIPGYLDWIGIVDVAAGRETSIYATFWPRESVSYTGSISVESNPSGASVILDSRPQGKTPISLLNLPGGTHTLILTYPGYEPVTAKTMVQEGQMSELSVTLTPYKAENLSPSLITLSDDAATYFNTHGRTQALRDFENPGSGFIHDTRYLLALDLNGTVLVDGKNPDLVGVNLSEQNPNKIATGLLISSLARIGGGLMYATNMSEENNQISLLYVRPAINGIILVSATPVEEITPPTLPGDFTEMQQKVHEAVLHAREMSREDAEGEIETNSYSSSSGVLLHPFDVNSTDDTDQNGVSTVQLLTAAAENGGGFVFLPLFDSSDQGSSLIPGYAEMVDDSWGIWASPVEEGHEIIAMMDAMPVVI